MLRGLRLSLHSMTQPGVRALATRTGAAGAVRRAARAPSRARGVRALATRSGVGHSGHLSSDLLKNQHDLPETTETGLTKAQRYLFDLNGFLVLKNAFDADAVKAANEAVDAHVHTLRERSGKLRTSALYGRESPALAGDGSTGRIDGGGLLAWAAPHADVFRSVLAHPALVPALTDLVGAGYRLDHSPLLLAMERGAEGHTLHGGAVTEAGEPAWPLRYECAGGQMRNQLLTVCLQLTDAPEGAGGFCVVPGSHKANFPIPPALADLGDEELNQFVRQPALMAGDVLVFSEAALHGTLPWTAAHQRRTVIYRFAPAGTAYGRGYADGGWPEAMLDGMTAAQRSVCEPPYHPRMNRVCLDDDATAVEPKPREPWKIEFDEQVFGSRYF